MRYKSFRKLLSLLSPYLMVDAKQGSRCNHGMGHASPELILHCLLWYLAGGSHHDIQVLAGIAKSTFFACVHQGIDAVSKCPELALHFPTELSELKEVAIEFQGKSSFGLLDGCVGALDGWLCRI